MRRSLEGRNALITGANQGFGLAIARAYVEAGASVLMCARDAALLDRARAEVAARMTRRLVLDANRFTGETLGSTAGIEYVSVGRSACR